MRRIRNEKSARRESQGAACSGATLTDITVTDLCTDAEVNRRTFYRHFTDKYQLVTWIYDKRLSEGHRRR
ncbi:MAG: TetR family transcriptional regulator [Oscillospiraceae bacterium]